MPDPAGKKRRVQSSDEDYMDLTNVLGVDPGILQETINKLIHPLTTDEPLVDFHVDRRFVHLSFL